MGLNHSPKIVTDGLLFACDMGNGKSLRGAPVTNTLPSPQLNGYPTYGNGWGTYNTNQYNNNAYFSIGTISSVTNNIVTTSAAHPLRSYDVVMPQSTGGGVTAGTSYLVKAISATTFSLHAYNGSQDGSQGYINPATGNFKVYDDWANDVRVSINYSSFPTMWWGYPHMPNSALVKEIIPNGFNGIPGAPSTDCIRLHFHRSDATDGMAYGPDAAVTAGNVWTASFWARAVSASSAGVTNSFQIYNYSVNAPTNPSMSWTLGAVGVWQRYSLTWTANNPLAISYWFPGRGGMAFDVSNIQYELGSTPSNFAPGTRTSTQAILDMTRRSTVTTTGLTYGTNKITIPNTNGAYFDVSTPSNFNMGVQDFTISCWLKQLDNGTHVITEARDSSTLQGYLFGLNVPSAGYMTMFLNKSSGQQPYYTAVGTLPSGSIQNIVVVVKRSNSTIEFYANGVLFDTITGIHSESISGTGDMYRIGHDRGGATQNIEIYAYNHYSKALTAAEVLQNFNALRGKYGI